MKRPRKDGTSVERWRDRVRLGVDARTGKQRPVGLFADTRSELATKIARLQTDASHGIIPSTERMTLEQYLKRWLNDTVAPSKRAATVEQYERIIRHVTPHVGRMRLDRLTPLDVQGLLRALEREGKSVHLRGLVYVVLHAALKPFSGTSYRGTPPRASSARDRCVRRCKS